MEIYCKSQVISMLLNLLDMGYHSNDMGELETWSDSFLFHTICKNHILMYFEWRFILFYHVNNN